jgi:Fe-S-cluster-containing dehydrogenase component
MDEFLQKHYKELTKEEIATVITRLTKETKDKYGADVTISDPQPQEGVKFGYALNLSICIGCRKCAEACHKENNHDRPSHQSYIRVLSRCRRARSISRKAMPTTTIPSRRRTNSTCRSNATSATGPPAWMSAPSRPPGRKRTASSSWTTTGASAAGTAKPPARITPVVSTGQKPSIPKEEINPVQAYLSNRIRPQGVMEKCTFCLHRTRNGRLPACLEACPTGARVFGNLLDPKSEIRWVLENKRVFVLKEDVGTKPQFFTSSTNRTLRHLPHS